MCVAPSEKDHSSGVAASELSRSCHQHTTRMLPLSFVNGGKLSTMSSFKKRAVVLVDLHVKCSLLLSYFNQKRKLIVSNFMKIRSATL